MYWEDLFQSVDNIDVEAIDFVTSGFPPAKLALHWRWKADVVAKSKYFKFDTVGTTIKLKVWTSLMVVVSKRQGSLLSGIP